MSATAARAKQEPPLPRQSDAKQPTRAANTQPQVRRSPKRRSPSQRKQGKTQAVDSPPAKFSFRLFFSAACDQAAEPFQFVGANPRRLAAKQRRNSLFGRAL